MTAINNFSNEAFYKLSQQEKELTKEQQTLKYEIENLKTGVKPYRANLIEFKSKLEKELEAKFNENVQVNILADLLEIKDLKWKDAIECYMNNQMFYLKLLRCYLLLLLRTYYFDSSSIILWIIDTAFSKSSFLST